MQVSIDENNKLHISGLHQPQKDFIYSTALHTALIGGYQSGKSVAGTIKCMIKLLTNPGVPIAYYLPSYRLIKDMLVPKFEELFRAAGINFVYLSGDSKIITSYGTIMMRSLDNPSSIISYSVGYSLVDEFDVIPPLKMIEANGRLVARNSYKSPYGVSNSIDYVSTPEGFGFAYKHFVTKANGNKRLIKISTRDNAINLADSYIAGLGESYTSEQLKAYLDGEFVNLNHGTVYRNFNRKDNHTDRELKVREVIHVGMDFNVTNMAAIIHVIENGKPIAVNELVGIYDTASMIEAIKQQFSGHRVVIYPDASGANKKSSGKSDIKLLREAGFTIRAANKNPFVKDRVNAMNLAFKNMRGENTYLINTHNCPVYTEALEQQIFKNGEPDKTTGHDHPNDAGGYFITGIKRGHTSISAG